MDFPKEKHQCHPPKIYTQIFTCLGLYLLLLSNWYLGKCYSAFCLPFMNRQLKFEINPVKFQEWMIAFSFFILYMLVVTQFFSVLYPFYFWCLSTYFPPTLWCEFPLAGWNSETINLNKTSRKRFLPKCMIADAQTKPCPSCSVPPCWKGVIIQVGGSFHSAPDASGHLPGGIQPLLSQGKAQEWGQGAAACLFLFTVVIPRQNSDDKTSSHAVVSCFS